MPRRRAHTVDRHSRVAPPQCKREQIDATTCAPEVYEIIAGGTDDDDGDDQHRQDAGPQDGDAGVAAGSNGGDDGDDGRPDTKAT
eukprot:14907097-Alexandrium_andersonii.AAC.1